MIDETIAMLTGNLGKIAEHGKRADGIVKSMLEHSRGVSSERREVDINNLVEEALNLAYHGARAQDQAFDITLERNYDQSLGRVQLVPQEMNRVIINLIGNGFYAASKRQRDGAEADFRPTLTVATRDLGDAVEVRVRDNGVGIRSGDQGQAVPAVLHHQADRRGHRTWLVDQLRHRHPAAWRHDRRSTAGSASSPNSRSACHAPA